MKIMTIPLDEDYDDTARRVTLFAERMFARLPADLANEFPAAKRLEIAEQALDFMQTRSEPAKVRVFGSPEEPELLLVETVMPDCSFIVDSILEYFRDRQLPVRLMLHPLFRVRRGANGELVTFEQGTAGEAIESFTHAEIDTAATPELCRTIVADLQRILEQLREATGDFAAMTQQALRICEETAAIRELVEVRDFLRWLVQSGFVFLGYRRYRVELYEGAECIVTDGGSSRGIMRAEGRSRFAQPTPLDTLDESHRRLLFEGPALIIGKTRAESQVHRRALMDDVTIRRTGKKGQVTGFDRFIGLFTSKAYAEEAEHIPVLRAKLRDLIEAEGLIPATHDYKALVAAFNSFPKEELFRARTEELREQLRLVLNVENESEVRLNLEADAVRGNVIALVIMPRENFSAELRMRIQAALARGLGGKLVYYYLALGESYTARLHFSFAAPPPPPSLTHELGIEIARLARTWDELLRERLQSKFGGPRARELLARWLPAFETSYRTSTPPELAVEDIEHIEQLGGAARFSVLIGPASASAAPDSSELRMYEFGEAPMLSELVPVLQNFGIAVVSESAHEFRLTHNGKPQPAYLQSFQVRTMAGQPLEQTPGAALLGDALVAVRNGLAEDDPLNALTLEAGLTWQEAALLRAYLAAAFQMRLGPARPALRRPFLQNPQLARLLVKFFRRRFEPERQGPDDETEEIKRDYVAQLAAVENIADDRIARTLLAMVEATTRTNFFRTGADRYIALKFESGKLPGLTDTPPLYEIHVNSPTMQGCHLRAGRIARGGIRYSDRYDDFRTEILDLMKTQTVKNAIIVPMGSKGGFIVKAGAGRTPGRAAVVEAYSTLINALLDLTDNLLDGASVHPERVVVRDTDGPYLVVAADKGTAAFSDIANNIAESRGFWLGDAFASGGEHGYDHKKMGITARGAWESAKRHLREMGRDLRRGAPVTIAGIGDMSGDVFGNGLLQSDNVKLIAAFDHRHIFIDPSPDPIKSFAERQRLFKMPNSRWADYDPQLISPGGGVFKRGQKSIELSAAARAALGCADEELDGDRLVQAVLCAQVDLLYNGGIGTYVRADTETDAEVGDHANDSCRVTASELRCKIAVEGGNLGFTQLARIEYALAGGRINTDAIDNSAGVDMSDHEVNLKILLQPAVASGGITTARRNRLLASVGDEVAAEVLHDNRDQALLLSLEQLRSRADVGAYREHLTAIERRGLVRHAETVLPTHAELSERHARYPGLTRPELAVLTALTKIDLASRLEGSSLIDDPYLIDRYLRPYFPAALRGDFAAQIPPFRLRRELLATQLVNELVDSMGSVFVFNLTRDFGLEIEDAVGAWLVASGVLDLPARAEALHQNAENMAAEAELGAFLALEQPARRACAWAAIRPDQSSAIGATVTRLKPAFEALLGQFETALTDGERDQFERAYRELRRIVHEEELAHELARLSFAGHLLNVLNLSSAKKIEPMELARVYFGMSRRFEFATLESAIDQLNTEDRWERHAARDLRAELAWARNELCCAIIEHPGQDAPMSSHQSDPLRRKRLADVERLMEELRALPAVGLPPLQVTVRALARLASGV
jgi:glutamate dehydrogenase